MPSTEKSDVIKSLISLLEKNEKSFDSLTNKLEENSDIFRSLFSLLEKNVKRVDSLAKKIELIERINSDETVKETDSSPVEMPPSRSILVVDDDKKRASSLKLILESAGYVVDMAHNGVSAELKISKNTYDLVILDWNLQDAIGDQIAETIEKRHSETKIISIPGNTYLINEFARENEILLKPIEPEYLLETVAKIFPDEQIFECN